MLRMSVIILIGILVANGEEDVKSIETLNDLENAANLENSKIVTIKMKPNSPVDLKRTEIPHSAESRLADDDQLVYVEVRTGDSPETIDIKPSDLSTEINVSTRRFLTDNDSRTNENKEESRIANQEITTIDVVERTADNNQHDDDRASEIDNRDIDNFDQQIAKTGSIIGEVLENLFEHSPTAESKTAETEINRDSLNAPLDFERTGESTETPTRRKHQHHHNSSVLKNPVTETESVISETEHNIEIVRQGSGIIEEEDIEVDKSMPLQSTRRKFDDFENYPDIHIFDDDLIQTAKSIEDMHDILIDKKSRSGTSYNHFNVPSHPLYFSEPHANEYQYANPDKIGEQHPQNIPMAEYYRPHRIPTSGYQHHTNNHFTDYHSHSVNPIPYHSQNIPLAYQLHEPNSMGGYQQYNKLLIPNYYFYNMKPSFDYESYDMKPFDGHKRFYDVIPNVFLPHQQPKNKPITDYFSHNNNIYPPQDDNVFNVHQPRRLNDNYPPLFDYFNSITDYSPFITNSRKCFHSPSEINFMSTSHQPHIKQPSANKPYNIKHTLGYQPNKTKPLGVYGNNIKPTEFQAIADYTPPVTHTAAYQSHIKSIINHQSQNIPIISYQPPNIPIVKAPNTSPANYQLPKIPITDFQSNNIETVNQQLLFNDLPYNSKSILAYHTQDSSGLAPSSLHPRNDKIYHPVYGNHQHYVPQNHQPNSPKIISHPIQMGKKPEFSEKRCTSGLCYSTNGNLGSPAVNIMNPLNHVTHVPGLHDSFNFNTNLGLFRNFVPFRQNTRAILRPYQYPRHLVSVRSVDTDGISEGRDANPDSNNYPHSNGHKDDSFNMYYYESTTVPNYPLDPLSLESDVHQSPTSIEYYSDKTGSLNSAESLHSNPFDAIILNINNANNKLLGSISLNYDNSNESEDFTENFNGFRRSYNNPFKTNILEPQQNNPFYLKGRSNVLYETKNLNNNLRGSNNSPYETKSSVNYPYEPIGLANNLYELRGFGITPYSLKSLSNNLFESNIRSFDSYMTLGAMLKSF